MNDDWFDESETDSLRGRRGDGESGPAGQAPPAPPAPPAHPRVRRSREAFRHRAGDERRRRVPAGQVLFAVLVGFAIAIFLNSAGLKRAAEAQPLGFKRSVAVTFAKPIALVSHGLFLDRPGRALRSALGRGGSLEESGDKAALADLGGPGGASGQPWVLVKPTRARPLRCWVGGDSMTQVFGQELVTMMRATHVMRATLDYRISTGLSRPDYFDWPRHLQFQMDHLQPDVVVIMFGANDGQDVEYQGKVLKFGTPAWLSLYHERVGAAMDIALRGGVTRVYWVGQPITGLPRFNQRLQVMNAVYQEEAASRRGIVFIPTWDLFTTPSGGYSDYLKDPSGKLVLMRQGDDIHLTLAGGDRVATVVLQQIETDYHLTK